MRTIRQAGCSIYPTRLFIHKHVLMPEPDREGKGKAREPITQDGPSGPVKPETQSPPTQPVPSPSSEVPTTSSSSEATTAKPTKPAADPLSDYTCPICFPAPTNATITPCDHICCGSCLFAAAKAGIQHAGMEHHPGANGGRGVPQAWYVLLWSFLLFVILNVHFKDARFVARIFLGGMGKEGWLG